jgi:hypothetical protein
MLIASRYSGNMTDAELAALEARMISRSSM